MIAAQVPIGRPLAPLDAVERRRHKLRNVVQSVLLLGGMIALLTGCGWLLFGPEGVLGMGLGAALALTLGPRLSPHMVLRLYGARAVAPDQLPRPFEVLARLTERAGLQQTPRPYYIPSAMLNAFSVGDRDRAVIALTDGILRRLDLRELAGVLAHEISHIRNRDLWLTPRREVTNTADRCSIMVGMSYRIHAATRLIHGPRGIVRSAGPGGRGRRG
jgi:heat shock protein HtpX